MRQKLDKNVEYHIDYDATRGMIGEVRFGNYRYLTSSESQKEGIEIILYLD